METAPYYIKHFMHVKEKYLKRRSVSVTCVRPLDVWALRHTEGGGGAAVQRGGEARAPRHVEHVHQRLALVFARTADVARAACIIKQVLLIKMRLRSNGNY